MQAAVVPFPRPPLEPRNGWAIYLLADPAVNATPRFFKFFLTHELARAAVAQLDRSYGRYAMVLPMVELRPR
jgi:hypothetical protein